MKFLIMEGVQIYWNIAFKKWYYYILINFSKNLNDYNIYNIWHFCGKTSLPENFKWIVFRAKLKGLSCIPIFYSDKNKRRTKTVKKTLEPKWNQTFIYSPVHRREFRERMLEITLWDQARVREEESEFLGEVPGIIFKLRLSMSS